MEDTLTWATEMVKCEVLSRECSRVDSTVICRRAETQNEWGFQDSLGFYGILSISSSSLL